MDKQALREKYQKLLKEHLDMTEAIREINPNKSFWYQAKAEAYADIVSDLNK